MKQKILGITALFCAMFLAACSNIIEDLKPEEKFEAQSTNFSLPEDSTLTKVTSSTSASEEIVTVILNEDGTVTFTSVAEGKTTVAIKGTNAEGKTVTLTYEVSVDKKGGVEIGDTPAIFTNETEKVTPGTESVTVKSTENATANPADVVTVIVNDDGTVTITAEKAGTTTVTVKGKNENGETVTLTYTVTVAADGTISTGEATVFTNDTENVTPGTESVRLKSTEDATANPADVVTVIVNDDGTVTITAEKAGTTTVTVKGKNENGETVTLTYTVTVAADGTFSMGEPAAFTNDTENVTPKTDTVTVKTITSASSKDESVVTVIINDDGTTTLTAQSSGTTTLTVKGKDENGEDVTLTYTVTVAEDGTISRSEATVFKNETEKVTPKSGSTELKTTESVESADDSIVTVSKNDDGTISFTGESVGTTTVIITGTNENGEPVTLTYTVTVENDGTITVKESKVINPLENTPVKTVTSAVSGDESVITVIKNEDGTTTLTAQAAGTTTLTIKGKNENGETVTLIYNVTVAEDGSITMSEPAIFTNDTEKVTPKTESETIKTVTSAVSGNESVITVIKNEDGTTTLTAQSSGTTTFTVKGTNENDEIVTLTYTVTVAEDGTITVGEPTESVNGNATVTVEIAPESAISITSAQDGSTITLTASEGFTDYKWHIDGVSAESVTGAAVSGDGRTLTLTKANFTGTGVYQIYIIATKDSIPYDAQISVTNSTSN